MRIIVYKTGGLEEFVTKGFDKHGLDYKVRGGTVSPWPPCDLAVTWGIKRYGMLQQQIAQGHRTLVFELGCLGDRSIWTMAGYDGLANRAEYYNKNSPSNRGNLWRDQMKPWKTSGKHVLVLGQIHTDTSLITYGIDFHKEMQELMSLLVHRGIPFKYRPHPYYRGRNLHTDKYHEENEASLQEDLDDAFMAVTINSTTAVDAVMYGVPTITLDKGSLAWDVTSHELDFTNPYMPDRNQWLNDLAYTQWTREEIANGDAWEHLKQGMDVSKDN